MSQDTLVVRTRPLTAALDLESIRDGREIWIDGERVKEVAPPVCHVE
jgi:hypothetical protein